MSYAAALVLAFVAFVVGGSLGVLIICMVSSTPRDDYTLPPTWRPQDRR